ncbi:MAG TPA: hypothetical protein VMV10_12900 [Pirellulales bacterium]|nr:hypothetical protein [Pirellulales bacterium]
MTLRQSRGRWFFTVFVASMATCLAWSRSLAAEPTPPAAADAGERPRTDRPSSSAGPDAPASPSADLPPHRTVRYTDGRLHIERNAPTLGGVQLWGDEFWRRGWHIQRNALTGHCRLLDENNRREDWGSFEQCLTRFEELKRERNLPPMKGRAVILLHGLGGWHSTMQPLANYLQESGSFAVVNLTYPSTRADVSAHARALASVIEHLDGIEEINFVAHSLGNIVVRRYLADRAAGGNADPRIKRFVMLAPPNHGSLRADKWSDKDLFVAVLGASAVQLGSGWSELEKQLAVPAGEFGIIAGGRGDDRGYSSRLPGDDDNTLSVDATRLAGARDFKIVPARHSFIIVSPTVHRMTLEFLEHGYFVSEAERSPIVDRRAPR